MSLCLQVIREDNYTLSLNCTDARNILKLWLTELCNTLIRVVFHVDLVNWSQVRCLCAQFARVARWQCTRGSISSLALVFGCVSFEFFARVKYHRRCIISNQRVACSSVWWKMRTGQMGSPVALPQSNAMGKELMCPLRAASKLSGEISITELHVNC